MSVFDNRTCGFGTGPPLPAFRLNYGCCGKDALSEYGLWYQTATPCQSFEKDPLRMQNDYSREEILEAVRNNVVTFTDLIAEIQESVDDQRLHLLISRLLANIYVRHVEGRKMSRSQACRMIPADHLDTCKKYVAEAERLGFVRFVDDPLDKRRKNVEPTDGLISYVEDRAKATLDFAWSILKRRNAKNAA